MFETLQQKKKNLWFLKMKCQLKLTIYIKQWKFIFVAIPFEESHKYWQGKWICKIRRFCEKGNLNDSLASTIKMFSQHSFHWVYSCKKFASDLSAAAYSTPPLIFATAA